jgi:hypothetical protein
MYIQEIVRIIIIVFRFLWLAFNVKMLAVGYEPHEKKYCFLYIELWLKKWKFLMEDVHNALKL